MTHIRVLIADDHAVFRSGLKALLEREDDLEVVAETGDGSATIEAASNDNVDLLLLDISMPGLAGPQVAEAVLRRRPDLPIVVLTMHQDQYYLQELFKIGVRAFVLKKSTGTDVLQAIRAAHAGRQYVDPELAEHVIDAYVGRPAGKKKTRERLGLLTKREREICTLLAYGHTNAEIAHTLSISERTVETHRTNLMGKLGFRSRAELVRFAIDNDLLKLG